MRRLLFYCQHSLGMGHYVRSMSLAEALAERFDVLFLNGGPLPSALPWPAAVRRLDLPPLVMADDGRLVSLALGLDAEAALAARRVRLLAVLRDERPAVLVLEMFPFGRKKFADELVPLLEAAHAWGTDRPRIACSVRDLLVTARRDQRGFDDRVRALADRYFDVVLVHADPAFARLDESFRPSVPLAVPVHYTGFVARRRAPQDASTERRGVVVSAGGGLAGESLFRAAIGAQAELWSAYRLPMTIVAGPLLPEAAWQRLCAAASGVEGLCLRRSVPDLGAELSRARASVSQCGYNTVLDLVFAGVPALVIPFAAGREDEQTRRATRLAELGLVRTLDERALTVATLVPAIAGLLEAAPRSLPLDLSGAETTASLLDAMASAPPVAEASCPSNG